MRYLLLAFPVLLLIASCSQKFLRSLKEDQVLTFTTSNVIETGKTVTLEARPSANYTGIVTYKIDSCSKDLEVFLSENNKLTAVKVHGNVVLTAMAPEDASYKWKCEISYHSC